MRKEGKKREGRARKSFSLFSLSILDGKRLLSPLLFFRTGNSGKEAKRRLGSCVREKLFHLLALPFRPFTLLKPGKFGENLWRGFVFSRKNTQNPPRSYCRNHTTITLLTHAHRVISSTNNDWFEVLRFHRQKKLFNHSYILYE